MKNQLEPPILTVSQLTQAIKLSLESNFPSIWIQGEVSNCKLQTSGHLYFSLKDTTAQISAVMFRGDMASIKFIPKDGDQLIVCGEINVYPPSGKYQILVRHMRHAGVGELLLRLEELKATLLKRGWFRAEHKKPIPKSPKRIGVVTSPTGAVIQDIVNILTRRLAGFHLILNPVRVQGEGAAQEIAQAIRQFNAYDLVDVIIVGRGGGSIEDLWAFNEEGVAEAIFHSRLPIISAVGHETDHCIADYVADLRAPTPSAAAEIISADKAQQRIELGTLQRRLTQTLEQGVRQRQQRLTTLLKQPLLLSPYALLGPRMQQVDSFRQEMDSAMQRFLCNSKTKLQGRTREAQALRPSTQILHFRQKLIQWQRALTHAWSSKQQMRRGLFDPLTKQRQLDQLYGQAVQWRAERLVQVVNGLRAVDPKNLLTKGYCILFAENREVVITSIRTVDRGETLRVLLSDGHLLTTVKEVSAGE
jgi:exodeoxyribonuclease VII large subunit